VLIQQVIRNAGHRVVYRAPYYAMDGPIEYVFSTLQQALTLALYRITDENGLRQEIYAIVAGIKLLCTLWIYFQLDPDLGG
jgi:transposase